MQRSAGLTGDSDARNGDANVEAGELHARFSRQNGPSVLPVEQKQQERVGRHKEP